MKKIFFASLAIAVIFYFSSCTGPFAETGTSSASVSDTEQPSATEAALQTNASGFSAYYSAIELTNGYEHLENDTQRACYEKFEEVVGKISGDTSPKGYYYTQPVQMPGWVSNYDTRIALSAFKNDHPGVFWIQDVFANSQSETGTDIWLCSQYSSEELKEKINAFESAAEKIISQAAGGLSPFELELYLHDKLLETCSYDDAAMEAYTAESTTGEGHETSYTAYGALVEGKAVCQGYTDAMGYLLSAVGIDNTSVFGKSAGVNHIWNAVKIEGDWYYLDATWDDVEGESGCYDYFNITEEQLLYDHSVGSLYTELTEDEIMGDADTPGKNFNVFVPECSASRYNYYLNRGAVLRGFDTGQDEAMASALAEAAASGKEYFHIYVDPQYLDFDSACSELFDSYIYHFQTYTEIANASLSGIQLESSAAILKKERLHVITVKLKYK